MAGFRGVLRHGGWPRPYGLPRRNHAVEKNGLRPQRYADVAVWPYGEHLFTPHWDMVSLIEKLCRFGFMDAVDTQASFLRTFAALRRNRFIP